jgi:hypothetical protein
VAPNTGDMASTAEALSDAGELEPATTDAVAEVAKAIAQGAAGPAAYTGAGPHSRPRGATPDRSSAIRDTKDKGDENTSRSGLRRASVAQRADITTKSRAVGSK